MTKIAFYIILFFTSCAVFSQSADILVREAMENNPRIKSRESNIRSIQSKSEAAGALPPPTIGLEFSAIPINSINIFNKSNSNNLSFSQMFHLGGKLKGMQDAERAGIPVAEEDVRDAKNQIASNVRMSYYTIWQLDRRKLVLEKNLELLKELAASSNALFEINRINQADILTLRAEIEKNQVQILNVAEERRAQKIKLDYLLGRQINSGEISTFEDLKPSEVNYDTTFLAKTLRENNPSLRRMQNMVKMNEAMIAASKKDAYPDLMLGAMLMRMPQGMLLTAKSYDEARAEESAMNAEPMEEDKPATIMKMYNGDEYMYSLMASITLPFVPWSRGSYKNREQELLAQNEATEYQKSDMEREMFSNVYASLSKMRSAYNLYRAYEELIIPLYKNAIDSRIAALQNDKGTLNDIIEQNRMLVMQEMDYYMAIADYFMARTELYMMLGTNLEENQ